jgi:solute carrier family 35 protein F5
MWGSVLLLHLSSPDYVLGLAFIGAVAVMWAASSVLVQFLYRSDDMRFDSPFFVTYVGVSLFSLWLPTHSAAEWIRRKRGGGRSGGSDPTSSSSAGRYQTLSTFNEGERLQEDDGLALPAASYNEDDEEDGVFPEYGETVTSPQQHWTDRQHLRAAAWIAPVWFLANWTYNGSLDYTSITSSTVLASTSSLFTFLFAVLSADERFAWVKLAGVLLGVCGSMLTALHDVDAEDSSGGWLAVSTAEERHLWGDALGVVSAVGYGAYAVQTRVLCPHDESLYSMQKLLGYIGLLNMVALSPIALYQWSIGNTVQWEVVGFLVVKGLFDNVLSDYLWLRAVILTSATVATVGLGLTIPLAFISDVALGKPNVFTAGSVLGATAVLAGFVLVNAGPSEVDEAMLDDDDDDDNRRAHPSDHPGALEATHIRGNVEVEDHDEVR